MKSYLLLTVVVIASTCLSSATQSILDEVKEKEANEVSRVKKSYPSELHHDSTESLVRKKRFWGGLWLNRPSTDLITAVKAARKHSVSQMKHYCASCPAYCYHILQKLASKTVCEYQTLSLSCPANQSLKIVSALYGRKNRQICLLGPVRTSKCASMTALSTAQCHCDNKQHCSLKALNSVFGDPCRGTVKYLNVGYRCVKNGEEKAKTKQIPPQCKQCSGTRRGVCQVFQRHVFNYWGGLWGRQLDSEDEETTYDLLKDEMSRQ